MMHIVKLACLGAITAVATQEPVLLNFDPANFVEGVDNPYFPLVPGTVYRFEGTGEAADEVNVVTVTRQTRTIAGVKATVVHDQVFNGKGRVKEDTYDWFAQDRAGNVWYLGEATREYRAGLSSTRGSWEAGKDGARAGIVMWADPSQHMNQSYRQEYRKGVAEDIGKVESTNEAVSVRSGSFTGCLKTLDTTPLEPKVREHKFYCKGVGLVREIESADEGSELVSIQKPGS